tara:strand:+ start:2370 stop:2597 length:228 start_codon:yes stop_codon:yes gene_type:complete
MEVTLDRYDLNSLLAGIKPKTQSYCNTLTQLGFMKFTGNQHNEDWGWKWDVIDKLEDKDVLSIYKNVKMYNLDPR